MTGECRSTGAAARAWAVRVAGMSLVRSLAVRACRAWASVLEAAAGGFTHTAAGLLTRSTIERLLVAEWEDYGRSELWSEPRLFPWEQDFYGRFLRPGDRVLMVGCGTGRDLIPLIEAGHEVEGLDFAPGALATCRRIAGRLGHQPALHQGSIASARLDRQFDALVFSWWCVGYVLGREERRRALVNARSMLRPGGRILISYVLRSAREPRVSVRVARLSSRLARSGWRAEPGDRIALTGVRGPLGFHFEHHFAPSEIEQEGRAVGLQVVSHDVDEFGRLVFARSPDPSQPTASALGDEALH